MGAGAELALSAEHGLDVAAVRIGLCSIVAAAHVDFDVGKTLFGEVCLQFFERIGRGHVGNQAHVDLGDRAFQF